MNGTIVGTIAGTVAGTVAGMATLAIYAATLAISRRSVGRKPAVFVKASTATDDIVPEFGEGDTLFVDVEIWNNRKYPIRIRKISLNVGSDDTFNVETPDDWKQDFGAAPLESGVFYCTKSNFDLAPESRLSLECTLMNGKARAGERPCAIEVIYADKLREKVLRGQVPSTRSRISTRLDPPKPFRRCIELRASDVLRLNRDCPLLPSSRESNLVGPSIYGGGP